VRTVYHTPSPHDLALARELAGARWESGPVAALIPEAGRTRRPVATACWPVGESVAEWVVAAGTGDDAVALYLHSGMFDGDEGYEVLAAQLSERLRVPVLLLHYRPIEQHSYSQAVEDVLAGYKWLLRHHPASRIVLLGHSVGAALVLSALTVMARNGMPMPAAAVAVSPGSTPNGSGSPSQDAAQRTEVSEEGLIGDSEIEGADSVLPPLTRLDVRGFPPLMLACGDVDLVGDDVVRFAHRADSVEIPISLDVFNALPDGFPLLGFDATETLLKGINTFAATWLRGGAPMQTAPLTIRRVSWAGFVITSEEGTQVLVDPYLSRGSYPGLPEALPDSPITLEELCGVDVVAVTHAAYDHRGQSVEIVLGGNAELVSGPATIRDARSKGVPADRCAPMVSGVEYRFRDVTIKAVDARHNSSMMFDGYSLVDQPLSFLVTTAAGSSVFCGGDTSLSEDFKTFRELYHPNIAVLGIGGIRVGAVTVIEMHAAEGAVAAEWLGVQTVIPVHHPPTEPFPVQLSAELESLGSNISVVALDFGETWTAAESAAQSTE
jgi:L-ascorbate metabolism protein UlaG (beta-lactamase superfamily)/acetyl esterase/lipase